MRFVLASMMWIACDGAPMADAGSADAGSVELGCGLDRPFPALRFSQESVGVVPGSTRDLYVEFAADCLIDADIELTQEPSGHITAPARVHVEPLSARATFTLMGVSEGTVTLTATATHPSGDTVSADIEVFVTSATLPACAGDASGNIAPGGAIEVTSGTLAGASMEIAAGAARDDQYHVDPFDASIVCATDIVPEGYRALGPAVTFGPGHVRLAREIRLEIPVNLALLPSGANRGHVELAWAGPHLDGRPIAMVSPRFSGSASGGQLGFEAQRLGTYQAIVRTDVPMTRTRRYTFRGILGFSMGGSGSGRIGLGNPEMFDFVVPLGGPTDWTYMLEHIRNYHVGGFCTEAERVADPEGCAMGASLDRVPPASHLHEHRQHFEHWWYDDGYEGQGGTFNRTDYISIFRDLGSMYGNPNSDANDDPSAPNIAPPGVPESHRLLPDDQRCLPENQVRIASGYYDDEFNPEGTYPVITFCDGGEGGDIGLWSPDAGNHMPMEVVVAVDLDGDGVRDRGEPVIRNGRETFDDFGLDGVPNEDELSVDGTAYDPITNPDPAGDDFDFQYNPGGTENNWNRDGDPCGAGERFDDHGLDGVDGTPQLSAGGYDNGEDNGCFDRARGATRMIETSPRWQIEHMDEGLLANLDVMADGGIRDLFNWVVMGNVTMAGFMTRGRAVRYFNTYSALHLEERGLDDFGYELVPWDEVGRAVMVRYGHPDTPENIVRAGDGGHVGTISQLTDRVRAGLAMMGARWPDGNRARAAGDRICTENDPTCSNVHSRVFDFTASTGRVGPVSIVLPPGYFDAENAGVRYPVVYFLHGYGMSPEQLVAFGLFSWEAMNSPRVGTERRMQKMILVFPDGRCRNNECLRGTFYTDAPESTPDGAQMQTFLLDLMEHIDANYRTREAQEFQVTE
jgi:hypothetical protein